MPLQLNSLVQVTLDGVDLGKWQTRSGGETEADMTSIYPGGGAAKQVLGGKRNVTEVTVSTHYRDDLRTRSKWIDSRVGLGSMSVSHTILDSNNVPLSSTVWTGILSGFNPPEADSDSNDPAMVELTMEPNGDKG